MKSIYQLIPDIYHLVEERGGWFTDEVANDLSREITTRLKANFGERKEPPTLRLSKAACDICPCQLWHSIHRPETAEPLEGPAILKFSYGHIIEAQTLTLAKQAGHSVTGEQDELVVNGIKGHRDCVLDGYIVDVKSCSGRMFEKIQRKRLASDDLFGYLDQLDGYMVGSIDDPIVKVKDVAFILAVHKETGKLCLHEHHVRKDQFLERLERNKDVVANPVPPACTCEQIKDGESGNYRLGVKGSYNPHKRQCFPNLRSFLFSEGIRHLTRVVREPARHVPELIGGQWVTR